MPLLKNRRGASHFVHAESLSEKVQSMERATLRKAVSHEDLRYPVGPWQALTRNKMFEHLTLMMVLLNVVWLGVSTNYTVEEPLGFQLVDNLFCAFFTFEILVRFLAFGQKSNIFRDYAFLFDLFLVLAMIWETWAQNLLTLIPSTDIASNAAAGSSVLRIFRILRVARTTRFVRLFPELSVFLKGLLLGMRALFATLCALSFCIYIFAIVFTQLLAGTEVGVFDNVLKSMNFLFLAAITSIDKKFIGRMMDFGWLHWGLFLLYLLVANLAIMKMMTGVLVNVVTDVSKKFEEQVAVQRIQEELQRLLEHLDADHNGSVSKEEFDSMLDDETLLKSLLELGVDIVAFVEFTRPTIPPEGVYVQDLVRGMLQFRGRKVATVKDIVDTRLLLAQLLTVMHERGTP